jgi:hypothetical protein
VEDEVPGFESRQSRSGENRRCRFCETNPISLLSEGGLRSSTRTAAVPAYAFESPQEKNRENEGSGVPPADQQPSMGCSIKWKDE